MVLSRILIYSASSLLGHHEDDKLLDIELDNAFNEDLKKTLSGEWDRDNKPKEVVALTSVTYVKDDDPVFVYTLLYK